MNKMNNIKVNSLPTLTAVLPLLGGNGLVCVDNLNT